MLTVHPETSITTDDSITLLRTQIAPGGKRLLATKTWTMGTDGAPKLRNYDQAKTFDFASYELTGAESLFAVLAKLESMPSICAVRGTLRDGEPTTGQRTKERLLETAHRWVALDLDSIQADRDYDWSNPDECRAAAEYLRSLLPAGVREATTFIQWTSGHGFKPAGWDLKVDAALFSAYQPHYTAAPLFEGVRDPVALRHVVLPGEPCATVPDSIEETNRPDEPAGVFELGLGDGQVRQARRSGGGSPSVRVDPDAMFRDGVYAGRSVSSVAAEIGWGQAQCCCPHDDEPHSTDVRGGTTAILHAEAGTPTTLFCFACSTTYVYGERAIEAGHSDSQENNNTDGTVPAGVLRVSLGADDLTASGHLDPRKIALRRGGRPVVVLQVGLGKGKTEVAKTLADEAKRRGVPTIVVAPTRSLSRSASGRFGIDCYLDMAETGALEPSNGIAVCLPSLPRVDLDRVSQGGEIESFKGLLVLDEIEQQLRMLSARFLTDAQAREAWTALVYAVRHARTVLLLDADAGELTLRLLDVAGRLNDTAWFDGALGAPRNVHRFAKRSTMEVALLDRWSMGHRVFVVTHGVNAAEALGRRLKKERPGTRVAIVTKRTVADYDLTDVNKWASTCDAIVCTPVIGTGVSIDVRDRFHSVWAFASDAQGTAHDLMQQVSRVRHVEDTTIRLFARHAAKTPAKWEANPDAVFETWLARRDQTARVTGVDFVEGDRRLGLNPTAETYLRTIALAHALDVRHGRGRVGDAFCELIEARGGKVETDCPTPPTHRERQVREELREAKKEVEHEEAEAVVAAPTIDEAMAQTIRRRGAKSQDEARSYTKYSLQRFTGGTVDVETVLFDDDGRGRKAARTYSHVVAVAEKGRSAESIAELDKSELSEGISPNRLQHRTLRARALLGVLSWVGLGGEALTGGHSASEGNNNTEGTVPSVPWTTSAEKLEGLRKRLRDPKVRAALELLGLRVPTDFEKRTVPFLAATLARLGLRLALVKQIRKGTVRERVYGIDAESLTRIRVFSAAYRAALASTSPTDADLEAEIEVDLTPASATNTDAATLDAMLAAILAA